jgi:hypothetical protein
LAQYGSNISWGADVPVSMPAPLRASQTAFVDMHGFTFTAQGIAHNITEMDLEAYVTPTFAPAHFGLAGEAP